MLKLNKFFPAMAINRAGINQQLSSGKRRKMAKRPRLNIKKAIKKPGALRKSLGIKKGKTIPASMLAAAAKKPGKKGRRARFAQTLKKLRGRKRNA